MKGNRLTQVAAVLAVLFVVALAWLCLTPKSRRGGAGGGHAPADMQKGSNPNLDVKFSYDANRLAVGPFVDNAEFPFLLEGDGWSLMGKRIRGMATLLHKEPVSALYDWLGVMQMEGLEKYYDMQPAGEPVYEDWQVDERLAVHQQLQYDVTKDEPLLPGYFPVKLQETLGKGNTIYIEGWVFFTDRDLFFFQAVSGKPLSEAQRSACDDVLQSLQFDAMLGAGRQQESTPQEAGTAEDGDGTK